MNNTENSRIQVIHGLPVVDVRSPKIGAFTYTIKNNGSEIGKLITAVNKYHIFVA